ncbi:MAG: L,D-transpeptidase family protein [Sphingomicrobium sp.]
MKSLRVLFAVAALAFSGPAFASREQPIEPIPIPPSIDQGVDMMYIDPEISPSARQDEEMLHQLSFQEWTGAPLDMVMPVNRMYTDLRRGLVRYQMRWGSLPQLQIPAGPSLKAGSSGERVAMLRQRLGLALGEAFDPQLASVIKEYQAVHGLTADGIAGGSTIDSLNLGAGHYEHLIIVNLERARRLPPADRFRRYILIDAGAARLFMYDNGRVVDSMKIGVGTAATPTPMMAAQLRYVSLNPYWNVPPELAQTLIAPHVLKEGLSYLTYRHYEVLSDWSDDATPIELASVDWQAVADGKKVIRLRRGPSPGNSMGDMKFMLPNDFGIYLHDYPDKSLFAKDDRWISNGCVRLEDAHRLARWLLGEDPQPRTGQPEEEVDLPQPVPVFMTYFTVAPTGDSVVFRPDPYKRDPGVLARFFGGQDLAANSTNAGDSAN